MRLQNNSSDQTDEVNNEMEARAPILDQTQAILIIFDNGSLQGIRMDWPFTWW